MATSRNPVTQFLTAALIFAAWAWVFTCAGGGAFLYYWYSTPEVVNADLSLPPIFQEPTPDPAAPQPPTPPNSQTTPNPTATTPNQTTPPPANPAASSEYVVVQENAVAGDGYSSSAGPYPVADTPVPPMPEPSDTVAWTPKPGAFLYQLQWGGDDSTPGGRGQLWLYLPTGELERQSLPCVLIGPSGTDLLHGAALEDRDMAEHIPYVQAGFAVVAYSIDGDPKYDEEPYRKFRDAMAGVVNARNAMEFVRAKVPEVDPKRIFAAGHSSAGTLALLFAAHEPRVKGTVAYMPIYDVPAGIDGGVKALAARYPDARTFATQSSPKLHAERIGCPVFLFASEKDGNVPASSVRRAQADLDYRGKDVTLQVVPAGDHYRAMLDEGIPAGLEWMKAR